MKVHFQDEIDLQTIVDSGQCFSCGSAGAPGTFWFESGGRLLLARQNGGQDIEVLSGKTSWDAFWRRFFDYDRDYRTVKEQMKEKGGLCALAAEETCGLRVLRQDPWETLIAFIISQRKSIPAIRTCLAKLSAFGAPVCFEGTSFEEITFSGASSKGQAKVLTRVQSEGPTKPQPEDLHALPSPKVLLSLTADQLASCGCGYRASYLHDAAEKVMDGSLDLQALKTADDEALQSALMQVKGVGVKVADCVRLFAYGRTSAVPADVWIKRVQKKEPSVFDGLSDPGIAQQYLFCYARRHGKEI